jgi:thiol-disulfide isomerase/thioredoxin
MRSALAALPLLSLLLVALSPAAGAESAGDAAYDELRRRLVERPASELPREEAVAAELAMRDRVSRLAEEFVAAYPQHPRRWEAVGIAIGQPRRFDGPAAEAEKAAWETRRLAWREELLAASDVPENVWVGVAERKIYDLTGWRGEPIGDLAAVERTLDEMGRRAPASPRRKFAEPAAAEARARRLQEEAAVNPALAQMAAGVLAIADAKRVPLALRFTAADGREVDLAALRGKVVLIDFWATWCKPCMDEMPNVRRVYEAYRDRGFEVVGISFDKAPGESPRGMEKTAAQVAEFARANGMSWPTHYDGQYWDNELGRRFAIRMLPTVFLLDRSGRLATTDAKGEKLEPAVRSLLGL